MLPTKLSNHPMAGVTIDHMCNVMAVDDQTEAKMAASLAENDGVYFHF